MNVDVKLIGTLHKIIGTKKLKMKLEKETKIKDILNLLIMEFPKLKEELINPTKILILLNGIDYKNLNGLNTQIIEDSEIILLSITHGG